MKTFTLILDDAQATLTDENDDEVWCSEDEENFQYGDDTSESEVLDFLVKSDVIDSADDVTEIVDERDDSDDNDSDDDDDDDDDDEGD